MRIAVVAPNTTIMPPPNDGGTEKIAYELSEAFVKMGHDVFLYARGGSRSSGTLISYPFDHFGEAEISNYVRHTLPPDTDIVQDHTIRSAMTGQSLKTPIVSTRHIPVKTDAVHPVYASKDSFDEIGRGEGIYIHNGLDPENYPFSSEKQNYLLFLDLLIPEKGVTQAIDVAEQSNSRLIIAGPKDDAEYFNKRIAPRLRKNSKLKYVGPVGGQYRQDLLKNARCVLFTSQWREPFGLVMLEAMACGTPVLALNNGAVSEVLKGYPQFVCKTPKEMARKLKDGRLKYSPTELREYVNAHFHINLAAGRYIEHFNDVIASHSH